MGAVDCKIHGKRGGIIVCEHLFFDQGLKREKIDFLIESTVVTAYICESSLSITTLSSNHPNDWDLFDELKKVTTTLSCPECFMTRKSQVRRQHPKPSEFLET